MALYPDGDTWRGDISHPAGRGISFPAAFPADHRTSVGTAAGGGRNQAWQSGHGDDDPDAG